MSYHKEWQAKTGGFTNSDVNKNVEANKAKKKVGMMIRDGSWLVDKRIREADESIVLVGDIKRE